MKIVGPDGKEVTDFSDIKLPKEFSQNLAAALGELFIEKAGGYGEEGLRAVGASDRLRP